MINQSAVTYTSDNCIAENKICLWNTIFYCIIVLMVTVPILYAVFRFMNAPPNMGKNEGHIQIHLSKLPEGKSQLVYYREQPVIVINNHGDITALSALCTRKNIILQWDSEREELVCSVYGSRFDLNGNVKSGLAPKPLKRYSLMVKGDSVIISS